MDVYLKLELTIGLSSLDFLEQTLEPAERRSITTDPEEFHASEATQVAMLLPVPNMLQN